MGLDVRGAERSSEPGSFDRHHEVTVSQTLELETSGPIGRRSRSLDLEASPATIQRFKAIQRDLCPGERELPMRRRSSRRSPPGRRTSPARRRRDRGVVNVAGSSNQEHAVRDGRGLHIGNLRMRL